MVMSSSGVQSPAVLRKSLMSGSGAAGIGFGSQTVESALTERINPLWAGAVGDGVADDYVVLQNIINNYGGRLYLPKGYTFYFGTALTVDVDTLDISGEGTLTSKSYSIGIALTDTVENLFLQDCKFTHLQGISTQNSTTSHLNIVRIKNIDYSDAEFGIHLNGSVVDGEFIGNRVYDLNRTLLDQSCQGLRVGLNQRANALLMKRFVVSRNSFRNIVNNFNKETHGCILYGRNILVNKNHFEGITHSAAVACEACYLKASNSVISGNTFLDNGPSGDGDITIKGGDRNDTVQVNAYDNIISDNAIYNSNESVDVIGIAVRAENTTIKGNVLNGAYLRTIDLDGTKYIGNNVRIVKSSGSVLCFEVENSSDVLFENNKFYAEATTLDVNTAQVARVRASAQNMDNIKFKNNEFTANYPGLTTGANTASVVNLWAENNDITNVRFENNEFEVVAPNIGSSTDRNALYYSGANIVGVYAKKNTHTDECFYYDSGTGTVNAEYGDNEVINTALSTGNKGYVQKVTDIVITNAGATATRTAFLPEAKVGLTIKAYCTSPTYTMVLSADSSVSDDFTDGALSKTLAVGASCVLRCYVQGTWHIEQSSGSVS